LVLSGNAAHPEAHFSITIGRATGFQGRIAEARQHFEETLRLNPNTAIAYYKLGVVLGEVGPGCRTPALREFVGCAYIFSKSPV
jgi:Flp pilus assembly protein TadD